MAVHDPARPGETVLEATMPHIGQRRHKRYEVHDVHGSLLFRTRVQVKNLSVAGLALETTERLQMGRSYAIHLVGEREAFDVTGTIRWCRLASTRPTPGAAPRAVYLAGLGFEDVFTEKARGLFDFLEHHVVLAPHQRLTGRFRAEALRPADLEARYDFEVLKLSLSGMLARASLAAAVGARFGIELSLRDGLVPMEGRIAFVRRDEAAQDEAFSLLGVEFVDPSEEVRAALEAFIAGELSLRDDGGAVP